MSGSAYRPAHAFKPPAPPPPPAARCACGEYACYFAGPPLQPVAEGWCPRCVPTAFFTWRCSRNPDGPNSADLPSYATAPRPIGVSLRDAELAMLKRLGRGELALADCDSKAELAVRLTALSALQQRGIVTTERTLTDKGVSTLAGVDRG